MANLLRSLSSFLLFLPVYLSAVALPTPYCHTILTVTTVYPLRVQTLPLPLHSFVCAAKRRTPSQPNRILSSPHSVQTPQQIFLRGIYLPVRLVARFGCACSFLSLSIGDLAQSLHRRDTLLDSKISSDRLFLTYPVACRATRCLISIGKRRARRAQKVRKCSNMAKRCKE